MTFEGLGVDEQWKAWHDVAIDPRPRVATGWVSLDMLLHRGSFGPGTFVVLAGRMHTRKTAVMVNLIANMLRVGVPVGLVGLDEPPYMYVAKLASVLTGVSHTTLEAGWQDESFGNERYRQQYAEVARLLSVTKGYRPSFDQLDSWLDVADAVSGARPRVVFVDYMSLLERHKFAGKESERIPRLAEELQVWTNRQELVTVVLHQVGRQDDSSKRYHGATPMTPEQLMYGGEQQADIILGTYRPAMDPVGNMSQEQATSEGIDLEDWQAKADRVNALRDITFLQLLKNRPGTQLHLKGIQLRSHADSQRMNPVDEDVTEDGVYQPEGA